jgi:hypothetical protein
MSKIECPKCHHKFELDAALAGPLIAQARAEADEQATERIAAARAAYEKAADQRAADAAAARVTTALADAEKAREDAARQGVRARQLEEKLSEAQAVQAAALKERRELEDARRELELTVERRTQEGLAAARQTAERAAEERIGIKLAERDETIASLSRTAEDLRRKLEQGSQQVQGESQETALEAALRARFPHDRVEPVAKGVAGADCLQVLVTPAGEEFGRILWESKQTKAWSPSWPAKLRDDGRAAKADLLVLVSSALPKGVDQFELVDGIWACSPRCAGPLATALRAALGEAHSARKSGEGLETKAGLVYSYLVGPKFRQRVGAVVEACASMQEDLAAEQRAFGKAWAKRATQIERALVGASGMYGDLQAIAGRSLKEIEGLSMEKIGGPS